MATAPQMPSVPSPEPTRRQTRADVSQDMIRSRRRKFLVTWGWKGLALICLAFFAFFICFPAVWMVSTSLKADHELAKNVWIPETLMWSNYVKAWTAVPFTRYTINTTLYALAVVTGTVISNSLVAYGFARLRFPGRDLLFGLLLSTMMIPGMVTMIPQYVMFAKMGWTGTYLPLIVPAFFGGAFFTFLFRQFFMGIPHELSEAAYIDGANDLWIWWKIVLPLSKPVLATCAIWTFEGAWNDYIGPMIYLRDNHLYTLQIGLTMFRGTAEVHWQHIMAASVVIMIPIIVLFVSFQRYFVEGAAVSGIKG